MHDDLIQYAASAVSKGRQGTLNTHKLTALLERTEVFAPAPALDPRYALQRIKTAAAGDRMRLSPMDMLRRYGKVGIPALVSVAIAAGLTWHLMRIPAMTTVITAAGGKVQVFQGGLLSETHSPMPLQEGAVITTETGSGISLETGTGSGGKISVQAGENSRFVLSRAGILQGKMYFTLTLEKGSVVLHVNRLAAGDSVMVRAADSMAEVKGTVFGVAVMDNGETVYEVLQGKIRMSRRIPSGVSLDSEITDRIKSELMNQSVILEEKQSCRIRETISLYRGMTEENFTARIEKIQKPRVKNTPIQEMILGLAMTSPWEKPFPVIVTDRIEKSSVPVRQQTLQEKTAGLLSVDKIVPSSFIIYSRYGDSLIMAGSNGYFAAAGSGGAQWDLDLKRSIHIKPLLMADSMYVASEDGAIVSLDILKGSLRWQKRTFSSPDRTVKLAGDGDSVYLLSSRGTVLRLKKDGTEIWRNTLGEGPAALIVTQHMIFVPGKNGIMVGFDKRKGIKVFKRQFDSIITMAVSGDSRMYLLTDTGAVICYDFKNDEKLWTLDLHERSHASMQVEKGYLYTFSTAGRISKISNHGEILWSSQVRNVISRDPVFDERRIYILCDQSFYVLKKDNGLIVWSMVSPPVLTGNITLSENNIYFAARKKGVVILKK
ncbi:MAG: hypothetical protein CVV44_12855 [Spirochaetae bacterium HGW-Spirochaetae-1]|jgi:outer membrane protein assembly factor BamB|nr:MAG: hypothetical protein CVV44_12855 [Spirochaetae bacterium HGW-Spirochaetae-1]